MQTVLLDPDICTLLLRYAIMKCVIIKLHPNRIYL